MDMKVSSDEIRSYVRANQRVAKQELPEEIRRVVLRLPVDSIDISPASRALQRGRLRVGLEEDGSGQYTKVTDENSNPVMPLLEEGMNAVKQNLDEMKKLTELMEDEELSIEDRYAAQMRLVDLEGDLEKKLYDLNEQYVKMAKDQQFRAMANLWRTPEDMAGADGVLDSTGKFDSRYFYIEDRATGEMFELESYDEMIDKRTELRKETINRVMMRELDPEAWEEYEKKLRETLSEKFRIDDQLGGARSTGQEIKELVRLEDIPEHLRALYWTSVAPRENKPGVPNPLAPEMASGVEWSGDVLSPSTDEEVLAQVAERNALEKELTAFLRKMNGLDDVPTPEEIAAYEGEMSSRVAEHLAELEKADYEELNGMRVSVMSAEMAEESGDYVENLTNQLTEQFKRFAAQNELIGAEGAEEPSPQADEKRMTLIADIAKSVVNFLTGVVLDGIQKMAIREEGGSYDFKAESSTEDGSDIFAPVALTPEEIWQMHRPDLFGSAEA